MLWLARYAVLHRIMTEWKNKYAFKGFVMRYFLSFTTLDVQGYWHGHSEFSLIVEIETHAAEMVIATVCEKIARNGVAVVMVPPISNPAWLV